MVSTKNGGHHCGYSKLRSAVGAGRTLTMETQLARANAMVLNNSQPASEEPSELNEGLKALDADDLWKKKNVYD